MRETVLRCAIGTVTVYRPPSGATSVRVEFKAAEPRGPAYAARGHATGGPGAPAPGGANPRLRGERRSSALARGPLVPPAAAGERKARPHAGRRGWSRFVPNRRGKGRAIQLQSGR